MNRGPVFIGGLECSGTSLIYALLASHPNIAMTRRTYLWAYFYNRFGDLGKPANFERCFEILMHYKRVLVLNPDPDRLRREFQQGEPTYARLFSLIEEHYAEQLGKPRWGDKSLNTERYAEPILAAYPTARFLHMIRDPRDRYASAVTLWKVKRVGIGAGTAMWLASVHLAQRNQQRYPEQYRIVRYETLALHPEETLRDICAFIGEDYSPAMLGMEGAETFRDEGNNSSNGQTEPGVISTKSIGRYRKVLSRHEIVFVQAQAWPEMLALDYTLDSLEFSSHERLQYACWDWPLNRARMFAWNTQDAVRDRIGRNVPSYRLVPDAHLAEANV